MTMMLVLALFATVLLVLFAADPFIARPRPIDDILCNPHMGFQTFQHFNGDPLFEGTTWTEVGPEVRHQKPASLETPGHPYSTVAYCRWYWDTIEPQDGSYRWDIIDIALETARERGQTLAIRVMCHDHEGKHDVPEWFRKTGARGGAVDVQRTHKLKYWLPDYSDPLYIKYWTRLNEEIAARYDGHPGLETVDCASIGPWGEWSTRPINPPMSAKAALIDCYTKYFRRTPLLIQFDDAPSMRYGVEHGAGWRADCLGDMGGFSKTWCHMYDSYPEGIIYGGAVDAWKTAPVHFEVCWVMGFWHKQGWDPGYIFDQAVKWHFTCFNTKSSRVPDDHWPAVNRCLKRMGYRFVMRKFLSQPAVERGRLLRFNSWWENKGCAPIYRKYDLAFQFKSSEQAAAVKTDADMTKWFPGDIVYDSAIAVPYDLPAGKYQLCVALVCPETGVPKVRLAQEGRQADGWYALGEISVE